MEIIDRALAACILHTHYVAPLVAKGKRVVVIISDALRYEVADELATRLRRYKDSRSKVGFEASIEPTLGVLPSYTQLGMAALLPHTTIGFTASRRSPKSMARRPTGPRTGRRSFNRTAAMAIQAEDLAGYTVKELRSLTQQQQLMYVYHNRSTQPRQDRHRASGLQRSGELRR